MPDWLPTVVIGSMFTLLGVAKLIGLAQGIEGGRGQSFVKRLCGT